MRYLAVIMVSAALVLSAMFAGCTGSKVSENAVPEDSGENETGAFNLSDFDLSKYNATLPSGENIFNDITLYSNLYGVRVVGTPQHDLYAQDMLGRFASYGLDARYQEFSGFGATANKNVLGFKWGANRSDWVVFGAHYDTFATAFGAYDNLGGCAAVMEMARVLSKYNFTKTLVFALWDCEEWGLYGSAYFAKTYKANVSFANFNYDCYGLNYPISNPGTGEPLMHNVGISSKGSKNSSAGISFNSILMYVADEMMKIPKDLQSFHNPASNSDHASFGKSPVAYFYSDPASYEILCYPNVPLDTYATFVAAAGGPDPMKQGLEFPVLYSYYCAILWSECGFSAPGSAEQEEADEK
ncbi:MAG: M28 family peptidase [Candidatus Thermoplasmatota archaeon]|nr:M28 family peptidase [Candidatus Thermoplasmatota archaeon]